MIRREMKDKKHLSPMHTLNEFLGFLKEYGSGSIRAQKIFFVLAVAKKTSKGTDHLSICWNNDKEVKYPTVWLRDNCRCPECYSPSALARLGLMRNLDVNITITSSKLVQDKVKIIQDDTVCLFHSKSQTWI